MIINSLIDLELTQLSGQTSQPPWIERDGVYSDMVYVGGKPTVFSVKEIDEGLAFEFDGDVSKKDAVNKLNEIYDLNFDLDKFYKYLSNFSELEDVSKFCRGLRIFQAKDPFECIISSICSANNSIARWTKSIAQIKEKWGVEYKEYSAFPEESAFVNIGEDNLKSCGVGYRAPYMIQASELFTLEIDLSEIYEMSYEEAFETIIKVPGVGPKVADCILLYGFGFKEAFPSDVWIKRIVSHLYFDGKDITVPKVRQFGMDEFGDYAGYVQLYLFHYARKSGLMDKLKK